MCGVYKWEHYDSIGGVLSYPPAALGIDGVVHNGGQVAEEAHVHESLISSEESGSTRASARISPIALLPKHDNQNR